ncbi:DUF493 domain-containing protein [Sphingobacterium psychroaquaticum]|uniref:Uncharacterized protein n=1 Tax=Sphingobacterium psychroaquaticum TaxID=561061 RepID=A0A1X7K0N6_9SPHI|nr:DUF493 domain-containing protein [Sphingobacterium psychroaquaticum]QBQ42463.1 DUF493 domain-containing protein [Sphingobacterium psychroaquaticum]SMG34438.1 hypothetical protein SAMN05660862_2346 [Sphingobacterium psychroaquaticum]
MTDFNNINIQDLGDDQNTPQDFYDTFREKLNAVEQFPSLYTFKFILKADLEKIEQVKAIFEHPSSKFSEKESAGGKYKSITVETFVNNAEDVINYYKEVSKIESVMML